MHDYLLILARPPQMGNQREDIQASDETSMCGSKDKSALHISTFLHNHVRLSIVPGVTRAYNRVSVSSNLLV